MNIRSLLGSRPICLEPDGFMLAPDNPNADLHALLSDYLTDFNGPGYWERKVSDVAAGRSLLALCPADRARAVGTIVERLNHLDTLPWRLDHHFHYGAVALLDLLCAGTPPVDHDTVLRLLDIVLGRRSGYIPAWKPILKLVQSHISANSLTADIQSRLRAWAEPARMHCADDRKRAIRIHQVLGDGPTAVLIPGDGWADIALKDLTGVGEGERKDIEAYLSHAQSGGSATPSAGWLRKAASLIDAIGRAPFADLAIAWLKVFAKTQREPPNEVNADAMRGIVWSMRLLDDPRICSTVGGVAEAGYRKIPNVGATSAKVGNACFNTLGSMSGMEPVMQLERLRRRVKLQSAHALIERALAAAAERAGLTTEEMEEIAVPTFGMDEPGRLREEVGGFTAELRIGTGKPSWQWYQPDGKPLMAAPGAAKCEFASEWKAMKSMADEIGKSLPVLRDRLERHLLSERHWDYTTWRSRYLDHPLVGTLARRLIWRIDTGESVLTCIWHDGSLRGLSGEAISSIASDAVVSLWHPLECAPDTVLCWRKFLEDNRITQPFKQAHREVYILTDAEVQTGTYSNRFAAHILKQHQFSALCRQRGWRYQLQGAFDSADETARLPLQRWGLEAQFWVERPWEDAETGAGITEVGIFLHVATDQVRFADETHNPVPLSTVPALVFSEVMRDVDLFVGVCSVANDPAWRDRGDLPPGQTEYWTRQSFGEIGETARTRRDVLERLIPRLKIADRCHFSERFLHVRGSIRTYKIHLGSGNILMEPNDQYLCIVPDRTKGPDATKGVFLPFEGDQTLAVIISKALLLADDAKVTDPVITSQIGNRKQ